MIIEPCCAHNQLPDHLRKNQDRLCAFMTNGDVTLDKFLFAVSFLVGSPFDMVLVCPPNIKADPIVAHYRQHSWLSRCLLLQHQGCNLLLLRGKERNLLIQGPLFATPDLHPHLYTAYYGAQDPLALYYPEIPSLLKFHAQTL